MTRSRFLSLIASLPAAGSVRSLQAQLGSRAGSARIDSGSLLVILEGQQDHQELSLCAVDAGPFAKGELSHGRGLAYALAPDRSAIYVAHSWNGSPQSRPSDQPQLALEITEFSEHQWRRDLRYPTGFRPIQWSLAMSTDGAFLYTFIRWLHPRTLIPQPGTYPTDTDGSYYETFAFIFDTRTGNFLPKAVEGLQGGGYDNFDGSTFLVGQALQFDVYSPAAGSAVRYRLSKDGAIVSSEVVPVSQPNRTQSPGAQAPFEKCSARGITYFVHDDGRVVVAAAGSYGTGRIDPPGPGRQFLTSTLSQDGKLLFVPSGPGGPRASGYIDRITIYETGGLTKVRQLDSQRPLGPIAANTDGSRIYAILPDTTSIAVLNSLSLWEEKLMRFNAPVKGVAVVP